MGSFVGVVVGVTVGGSDVGERVVGSAVGGGKYVILSARATSILGAGVGCKVVGDDEGRTVGDGRSRFGFPASKRRDVTAEVQLAYEYGFKTFK